jgi:hypothetical protein
MKLEKDPYKDTVSLHCRDIEFSMIVGALRAASSDDARKGVEYVNFYGSDKGGVVRLLNEIESQSEAT